MGSENPCYLILSFGPIAQLAEHRADNAGVSGSSPLGPTKISLCEILVENRKSKFENI